jgi:Raf kinase inhibitor-like YbhB/YbcL family protein
MRAPRYTAALIALAASALSCGGDQLETDVDAPRSIRLTTSAWQTGRSIPQRHTCDGEDVSPPLSWRGGPAADSYALIVTDPDAPDGTFVHWVVYAIPGDASSVPESSVPAGASEGVNGFGDVGYGGPCPPEGDDPHEYVFTLYAVKGRTEVPDEPSAEDVLDAIDCCVQARGQLTGTYGRP